MVQFQIEICKNRSLCGSIDVARRALHPKMPLEPAFIDYNLSLPNGAPRLFMASVVSLLPGTLSAELLEGYLKVHVLDVKADVVGELQSLESKVGAAFAPKPPPSVGLGE